MSTLDPAIARRHTRTGWQVQEEPVALRTLDEVCETEQVGRIDLLKIDGDGPRRPCSTDST
jgi:hypothetical protein